MAYDSLIDMTARTIWVDAWAREWESAHEDDLIDYDDPDWDGPSKYGGDLMDQAPDTPDEAVQMAEKFLEGVERLNPGLDLEALQDESGMDEDDFAFKLTMEAMGHGVGLEDDGPLPAPWGEPGGMHQINLPHLESDLPVSDVLDMLRNQQYAVEEFEFT